MCCIVCGLNSVSHESVMMHILKKLLRVIWNESIWWTHVLLDEFSSRMSAVVITPLTLEMLGPCFTLSPVSPHRGSSRSWGTWWTSHPTCWGPSRESASTASCCRTCWLWLAHTGQKTWSRIHCLRPVCAHKVCAAQVRMSQIWRAVRGSVRGLRSKLLQSWFGFRCVTATIYSQWMPSRSVM